jgi:hypothetical protein
VDELMTMQGVYRKWVGTLSPSLEASGHGGRASGNLRARSNRWRAIIPATIQKTKEPPERHGFYARLRHFRLNNREC